MSYVHELRPSTFNPLQGLLKQLVRYLGMGRGRDGSAFHDAFDFGDALTPTVPEHTPEDRDRIRGLLGLIADKGIALLDGRDNLMFDGVAVASADLADPHLGEWMVDQAIVELGPHLRSRPKPRNISAPAPLATTASSRPPESPMKLEIAETDAEYARRANAAAPGQGRISPRVRAALESTPTGQAALADVEEADPWGGRRDAPAPNPSPAADAAQPYARVVQLPPPPTAEEEARFVGRLAALGTPAADALRTAIRDLSIQAEGAPRGYFSYNWPAPVRTIGEKLARSRAMLAAVESGKGKSAYRAPKPEDIAESQGRLVATVALSSGKHTLADLSTAVHGRLGFLGPKAAEAASAVEALMESFVQRPDDGIEALRDRFHKTSREAAEWEAEVARARRTAEGIDAALAAVVARAVDAAGGADAVARDLVDVRLIAAAPATPDRSEAELAEVESQLRSLGVPPGQAAAGRAAQGLQARHGELTAEIERRRSSARAEAAGRAEREVADALSGRPAAVQALAAAVAGRPDAFADGFAKALADAPEASLEAMSCAGFAGILL